MRETMGDDVSALFLDPSVTPAWDVYGSGVKCSPLYYWATDDDGNQKVDADGKPVLSNIKVKKPSILRSDGYHVVGEDAYAPWGDPPPLPRLEETHEVPAPQDGS